MDLEVTITDIGVTVKDDWVTLRGTVDWYDQISAVPLRLMPGGLRVSRVWITASRSYNHTYQQTISKQESEAPDCNADADRSAMTIFVEGSRMTREGIVRSGPAFGTAREMDWRAKGVTNVTNDIVIQEECYGGVSTINERKHNHAESQ